MKYILTSVLAYLLCNITLAQKPIAKAGKNGIFIHFGLTFPRNFDYVLERKTSGQADWKEIYRTDLKALNSQNVSGKIQQILSKNAYYETPSDSIVQQFYQTVYRNVVADSLYALAIHPVFLEAAGLGFFDTQIEPNSAVYYRVSKMMATNKIDENMIEPLSFPGKATVGKALNTNKEAFEDFIKLKYELQFGTMPFDFKIYRQVYTQSPFLEIFPDKLFTFDENKIYLNVSDSNVARKTNYRYVIVPFDAYGNEGNPSDTVSISNLKQYGETPILLKINAKSLNNKNAIRLSWLYESAKNMRGIDIYKSQKSDQDFEKIASVTAKDSVFIDNSIKPNQPYYYYIVINSTYNQGYPSPKVGIDLLPNIKNNAIPQDLQITQNQQFITLTWRKIGNDIRGFYVFRGEGFKGEMKQISGLINPKDSLQIFSDSIKHLMANKLYSYAIKSENTSYTKSVLSDTVFSAPIPSQNLPIPLSPYTVIQKNAVLVLWTDMLPFDKMITGYQVFRKENEQPNSEYLIIATVPSRQNSLLDSSLVTGKKYSYRIQSLSYSNAKSELSTATEVFLPKILPNPPASLYLSTQAEGIAINWDKPLMEVKTYKIYRFMVGKNLELIGRVSGQENSFLDKNIDKSQKYFYQITSIDAQENESKASEAVGN